MTGTPPDDSLSNRVVSAQNVNPGHYLHPSRDERNRYDMLSLSIPTDVIYECSYDDLERIPGVVKVTPHLDRMYLKISGKILGKRYPELIDYEKIGVIWDALGPALQVDRSKCDDIPVTFLHLTRDFRVRDPTAVISCVRSATTPQKYFRQPWSSTSISFVNCAKSPRYRDRLAVYNKHTEILRKPVPDVDPEVFKNVIRVEYQIAGSETVRRKLGIPDNRLSSVLHGTGGMYQTLKAFFGEPPPTRKEPTTAKEMWDDLAVAGLKGMFDNDPERAIAYLNTIPFDTRRVKAKVRALW